MAKPTPAERDIGRLVRSRFGGETHAYTFGDDGESHTVFLMTGVDCPVAGVTSYGTVGLSNKPQFSGPSPVYVELLGACSSETKHFDNLITSCVFESQKNNVNIAYGTSMKNIMVQYGMSRTLKHVTFVAPFLWENFGSETVAGKTIHWLLMLPISDGELSFLESHGIDALEQKFEQAQIDVYDIDRPSAV